MDHKTLHGLELMCFSMIRGNKCCHGNTFFLFFGLIKYFYGFFVLKPLHRMEPISFSTSPGNKCGNGNTFYVSWASKSFLGFFAFQNPTWIGADLFFCNTMATLFLFLIKNCLFAVPHNGGHIEYLLSSLKRGGRQDPFCTMH